MPSAPPSFPSIRHGLVLLLLGLAGCTPVPHLPDDGLAPCRTLLQQVDAAVARAGVQDQGPHRIEGFPYLRSNRLLASFRGEVDTPARFTAWIDHLASLDEEARELELRTLTAPVAGHDDASLAQALGQCRAQLLRQELADEERRAHLRAAVAVPDDYVTVWRFVGLYPLTAPLVSLGIGRWHADTHRTFAIPLEQLPLRGTLQRWAPPQGSRLTAAEVRTLLRDSTDPLGLQMPDAAALQRLFDTFAPVWEVDVVSDDDRIGLPYWGMEPAVDVARPTLFRLLGHTRFGEQVFLQLNYIVWFPARPGNDIYAGRLDGIHWRVTLGPDGEPWLYDAIHNCGCYHLYFPTRHLRLRPDLPWFYFERPLLPQAPPQGQPLVLRIAHRTHFIERVYRADDTVPAIPLEWRDYNLLRALPMGTGYRSLFGPHGLVAGTARPERFLLWPMGIRSPGAMRQAGRHPVAFVGRRHFDAPDLLDSLFERVP